MGERVSLNDSIKKNDLELILEVNRKAIEIETTVADQNEEMMALLNKCREKQDKTEEKIDKLLKQTLEENSHIVNDNVTKETTIVIYNEDDTSSKCQKAKKMGIKLIQKDNVLTHLNIN